MTAQFSNSNGGMTRRFSTVHGRSRTTKPRSARQSGSLSGRAQTSRRRLAMTRQVSLKIAQPFMAGSNVINIKSSPVKDGRESLSSLTGLGTFPNREPSHKWLGYFQGKRRDAENGNRDGRAPLSKSVAADVSPLILVPARGN